MFLLSAFSCTCFGVDTIDVDEVGDLEQGIDSNKSFNIILHADITLIQEQNSWWNDSSLYNLCDYDFTSVSGDTVYDLSFIGSIEGNTTCGEVVRNGSASFHHLNALRFENIMNNWPDIGGGDKDNTGYAYGGALTGSDSGGGFSFSDIRDVSFSSIVIDSSDWGPVHCIISAYGGAIYTEGDGTVSFEGNGAVTLEKSGLFNNQTTNFSYRDFYARGGAVYTPQLSITNTSGIVSICGNYITQGIATEVKGEGRGGALYASNVLNINENEDNIVIDSNSILVANTAEGGALFLADNGATSLSDNGLHIQFAGNTVTAAPDEEYSAIEVSLSADCIAKGGAIYAGKGADLNIENNAGNVHFRGNGAIADYSLVAEQSHDNDHADDPAFALGGAVYLSSGSSLSIRNNGTADAVGMGNINFLGNTVSVLGTSGGTAQGGAVYLESASSLNISENKGAVTFSGNTASEGGALFLADGSADATGLAELNLNTGGVCFSGNEGTVGGAVYMGICASVFIKQNADVTFSANQASSMGGALYMSAGSSLEVSNNTGAVSFCDNVGSDGGAIYGAADSCITISSNSGGVSFCGNEASLRGGAIYAAQHVLITNNGAEVLFDGNSAYQGGAIYAEDNATVEITNTRGDVIFRNNDSENGSIFLGNGAQLSVHNNQKIVFEKDGETGSSVYGSSGSVINISANAGFSITNREAIHGSAIYSPGSINILNNTGELSWKDNSVMAGDGAVFYLDSADEGAAQLSIIGNTGSIIASGNYAARSGGVVYAAAGTHIAIENNADIQFIGNSSRETAAAINTQGSLSVRHNAGAVIFGNNAVYDESSDSTSLCSVNALGKVQLSAAEGHSIEFRDAVHIASADSASPVLVLNEDYTDSAGRTHAQGGDIIFTGAYTEAYLAIQSSSGKDIDASRKSTVAGSTVLHNGRLIISHDAVLAGSSLDTVSDSGAAVVLAENGTLSQISVTIASGTTLQAGFDTSSLTEAFSLLSADDSSSLLTDSPAICGVLTGGTLTLEGGSCYAMYGGALSLNQGSLVLDAVAAPITLGGTNSAVLMNDEPLLLLFCDVAALELRGNSDAMFDYRGEIYGEESLLFEDSRVYLRLPSVPEPSAVMLCLLGGALSAARRRRAR